MDGRRLLTDYRRAVDYIDREIVRTAPRRRSPEGKVRAARDFNRALGDPQRAYPSIQIAGTSGKGTVAHFIAQALAAAGLHTGLHVSPYLQSFTEKTWIDGRYCSVDELTAAVAAVRPAAERFRRDEDCPASVHGMASLATSYLAFRARPLDVAVIETGLGGRFDLVRDLHRELCVITELGLDHTRALGSTVEEIAWHKAGIMEPGVPCVAARGAAWDVLERQAQEVGAPLIPVDFERVRFHPEGRLDLELDFLGAVELELNDPAPFLLRNAAIAAQALDRLARTGRPICPEHLAIGFSSRFPGRFEVVQEEPRVVLDCAHNAQKLAALCAALGEVQPVVVFAATGSRSPKDLLERLPLSATLIATELDLFGKAVVPADEIARCGTALGLPSSAVPEPLEALEAALESCPPGRTVLVTGSVYLVGRLRAHWYPTEDVILQRTSWPAPARTIDDSE